MYFPIDVILPIRDRQQFIEVFILPIRVATWNMFSSVIVPVLESGPSLMIDIRRRSLEVTRCSYLEYQSAT